MELPQKVAASLVMMVAGLAPAATAEPPEKSGGKAVLTKPTIRPGTLKIDPSIAIPLTTARMTDFDPVADGFRFINTFKTVTGVFDVTTSGLCGGMVYAALDYWRAGKPIPRQDYTPVNGTTLQSYLYARNMTALEAHMDKWVELHMNPLGIRDDEFFRWGLQGTNGGRLEELREKIDAGRPVPLGLKSLSGDPGADHVVLAYGYDMGRYKGDLGEHKEDLKIFIYEPNYGARKVTMVPKPERNAWCNLERNRVGDEVCWRTWFVQQNYTPRNAPSVPDSPREIILDIKTGGDDLRGGNDNVHATVRLRGGGVVAANNLNQGQRWIDHTWQTVGISLPEGTSAADVESISLRTTFSGGWNGDNWNVDVFTANFSENGRQTARCHKTGEPLKRFTGDDQRWTTRFPC